MNFNESISKELSIRSEYSTDFAETSTKLMLTLKNALLTGDPEEVHKVSASAAQIKDLQVLMEEDLDVLKLYVSNSITFYVDTVRKKGLPNDLSESIKRNYYIKIAHSHSKSELVNISFLVVKDLVKALNKYSYQHYSLVIKMALEYIHNNKFKFIYAKDVANTLKYNRSYLSKRFKDEVGETITDYIHKTKIEYSIELMESKIYHFNEIAEVLGYSNYSYFSKVFKKYYHMSPAEYVKH